MFALLLLQLAVPAIAACPTSSTTADLTAAVESAKTAFGNLDVPSFRAAVAQMETQLPCTSDEVTRQLAAEVHRMQGLLAFANRSSERAQSAFASARGIEPNYRFPETLVPTGNPVLTDYAALEPGGETKAVLEPASGRLMFDGQQTVLRSTRLPALFQHIDGEGTVAVTAYLWPNDSLPGYALPSTVLDEKLATPRARTRRGMVIGAIASAVVSGGLYSGAYFVNRRYDDPSVPLTELNSLRTTNNGLIVASGATLGLALGLGTTAAAVGPGGP